MEGVKDWTIDCLKGAIMGRQEGDGKKKTVLREQMKGVKDWAVDRLMQPKVGHHKGEGKKSTTLRVIELGLVSAPPWPGSGGSPNFHLGSVKVEEHEV